MSKFDKECVGQILAGTGTWFGAHLLRLIAKADIDNLELLRKGFPEEVEAVEKYRSCK